MTNQLSLLPFPDDDSEGENAPEIAGVENLGVVSASPARVGDGVAIRPPGRGERTEEFAPLFQRNYGAYGLAVVLDRAIADVRDGLKPVQRRIIYTMYTNGYRAGKDFVKSAAVVGDVLKERHPHGDSSVYDASVRLTQPFTMRYCMISGQGNFGASDGAPAAAYRYTEMRLSRLAEALISPDIDKETVALLPSYGQKANIVEPIFLPGHIPPVVNPIEGIAVGLSTNVPPHNLRETLAACVDMLAAGVLDGAEYDVDRLMRHMPGPDFPEGGRLLAARGGLREYMATGRGRMIVRADITVEQPGPGKRQLVVTALPPEGRDKVVASIIDAINDGKVTGLVAEPPLDETNEERTRIVLELKRDARPAQVLEELWTYTRLEVAVSTQLYFLFPDTPGGPAVRPRQVGMVEILRGWLESQMYILERRLAHDLRAYKTRLSVVEALIIGATNAQDILRIFLESDTTEAAKVLIRARYRLTDDQADVIAALALGRLTKLNRGQYETEKGELAGKIAGHEALLAAREKRVALLSSELGETAKEFGDDRRTVIDRVDQPATAKGADVGLSVVSDEPAGPLALALYADGTMKVTPQEAFAARARGVKADEGLTALVGIGAGPVLAATTQGRVFRLNPEGFDVGTRAGRGEGLARHLHLDAGERLVGLMPLPAEPTTVGEALYVVEVSATGKIKKSAVGEYKNASEQALPSLKLAEGDEVVAAFLSDGAGAYLLTSDAGQTLHFTDDKLNPQGRVGQGQVAMALPDGARIVAASPKLAGVPDDDLALLIVTFLGGLKASPITEYPTKGRATGGVVTTVMAADDRIVAAAVVRTDDIYLLVGDAGAAPVTVASLPLVPRARKAQPGSVPAGTGRPTRLTPLVVR